MGCWLKRKFLKLAFELIIYVEYIVPPSNSFNQVQG